MYENMFRYFLKTGKVDYLNYCLPTYIGILPITLLWTKLFGITVPTLQALNIFHMEFCILGVYLFALRYTKPALAALTCFFLLCFGEIMLNVPTFMTDIPYISALTWLIVIDRKVAENYQDASNSQPVNRTLRFLLWSAWCGILALSALVRVFSIVVIPLLMIYLVWTFRKRKSSDYQYAKTAVVLGSLTAIICLYLVRLIGVHPSPASSATTIPAILHGNLSQLQWKATLAFFLQAAAMAVPVFLLSVNNFKRKITLKESIIAVLSLVIAAACWRLGLFSDTMHGVTGIGLIHMISFLQLVLTPYACILFWRLLQQTLLKTKQGSLDSTEFLIVSLLSAHVASTLIMGSPFLRHYIPVFLLLTLFIIKHGLQFQWDRRGFAAIGLAVVFISYSMIEVWIARRMDIDAADFVESLTESGVPESQIDGGFSWYSRRRISPELGFPHFDEPGKARYQIRQGADFRQPNFFPFVVPWTSAPNISVPSYKLKRSLTLAGGTITTYLIDTQSQPKDKNGIR